MERRDGSEWVKESRGEMMMTMRRTHRQADTHAGKTRGRGEGGGKHRWSVRVFGSGDAAERDSQWFDALSPASRCVSLSLWGRRGSCVRKARELESTENCSRSSRRGVRDARCATRDWETEQQERRTGVARNSPRDLLSILASERQVTPVTPIKKTLLFPSTCMQVLVCPVVDVRE